MFVTPAAVVRRRDPFLVQRESDLVTALPVDELPKNALHDLGLGRVDDWNLARVFRVRRVLLDDGRVAKAFSAGGEALERATLEPAVGLLLHELQKGIVHPERARRRSRARRPRRKTSRS